MYRKISALVVALALSGIALPSLAQGAVTGSSNAGNGGRAWTAVMPRQGGSVAPTNRQQQQVQNWANGANNANQAGQQETRMERWEAVRMQREGEMEQRLNPGLIGDMRARMSQAGGIGNHQSGWQMNQQATNPNNTDPSYGRGIPRLFSQLMQQHALETQPYARGGNQ